MPDNVQFNINEYQAAIENMWQNVVNRRVQNDIVPGDYVNPAENEPINLPWEAPQQQENMPEIQDKIYDDAPFGWENSREVIYGQAKRYAIDLNGCTYIWFNDEKYWLKTNYPIGWEGENEQQVHINVPDKILDRNPAGSINHRTIRINARDYPAIDLYNRTYVWLDQDNYWIRYRDAGYVGDDQPQNNAPQPDRNAQQQLPNKILCSEDRALDMRNIRQVRYMGHNYQMADYMGRTYQHFRMAGGNFWNITALPAGWNGDGVARQVNPVREALNLGFRVPNQRVPVKKKKPVKKAQYMEYAIKDPALTYQDQDTKKWFTRKLDKYEKNYLTTFGYEALILACPELSKNGLGVELNEEEEIILNIAELADFYANSELSTSITNYSIEKFPTEYKHSYERHFKMIKQFKRNKKG